MYFLFFYHKTNFKYDTHSDSIEYTHGKRVQVLWKHFPPTRIHYLKAFKISS